MGSEQTIRTRVNFVYEYAGHGWARTSISNGTDTYSMEPSYVLYDPLFELLHAVVEILRYGSDALASGGTSLRWTAGHCTD